MLNDVNKWNSCNHWNHCKLWNNWKLTTDNTALWKQVEDLAMCITHCAVHSGAMDGTVCRDALSMAALRKMCRSIIVYCRLSQPQPHALRGASPIRPNSHSARQLFKLARTMCLDKMLTLDKAKESFALCSLNRIFCTSSSLSTCQTALRASKYSSYNQYRFVCEEKPCSAACVNCELLIIKVTSV